MPCSCAEVNSGNEQPFHTMILLNMRQPLCELMTDCLAINERQLNQSITNLLQFLGVVVNYDLLLLNYDLLILNADLPCAFLCRNKLFLPSKVVIYDLPLAK